MKQQEWYNLSADEQEKIMANLKAKWPSFKTNHSRSKTETVWAEFDLENFVALMDMPLYISWNAFQNEYNRMRREERQESMKGFLENYAKKQPLAAKMIEEIYASNQDYKNIRHMARMVLDFFPPENWPITRGEEE